jgi:hypothetical protein
MGISSANSTGQDDRLNNLLTCLKLVEKAHDERRRVRMQMDGQLRAPCRDVPFADTPNVLGNPEGDDQLQPAIPRPGVGSNADLERIRTVVYGLQEGRPVRHLPRAAQLPPIPGSAPIDSHRAAGDVIANPERCDPACRDAGWEALAAMAAPTRLIDLDKLVPTSTLRRPRRAFSGGRAFLFAATIGAAWAGYFVIASWLQWWISWSSRAARRANRASSHSQRWRKSSCHLLGSKAPRLGARQRPNPNRRCFRKIGRPRTGLRRVCHRRCRLRNTRRPWVRGMRHQGRSQWLRLRAAKMPHSVDRMQSR